MTGRNASRRLATTRGGGAEIFGEHYTPALRAARGEAPSVSRVSQLHATEFLGRTLHAHSSAEQAAILLASYHPNLVDLYEQFPLSTQPAMHPLFGHRGNSNCDLPSTSGTVTLCEQRGLIRHHPREWLRVDDDSGFERVVPRPWISDLLIVLADERGSYCVFWDIKLRRGDHDRPGPGSLRKVRSVSLMNRAHARYAVQKAYFEELRIHHVEVAGEQIDRDLANNLRVCLGWACRASGLARDQDEDLVEQLGDSLVDGTPPIDVLARAADRWRVSMADCKPTFYRSIWERRLRLDLFHPILIDRPMRAEEQDALVEYADWFAR